MLRRSRFGRALALRTVEALADRVANVGVDRSKVWTTIYGTSAEMCQPAFLTVVGLSFCVR